MNDIEVAIFSFSAGSWFLGLSTILLVKLIADSHYHKHRQSFLTFSRYRRFGLFLVCIPGVTFLLHYLFKIKISLPLEDIYLIFISLLCFVLFGKDMFAVKNFPRDEFSENYVKNILSNIKFLGSTTVILGIFFLYDGCFLLSTQIFPSADRSVLGLIIFLLDIGFSVIFFGAFLLYVLRKPMNRNVDTSNPLE